MEDGSPARRVAFHNLFIRRSLRFQGKHTMSDVPNRETFESIYTGMAPWDIGKPQPAFVEVADRVTGAVLNAAVTEEVPMAKNIPRTGKKVRPKTAFKGKRFL